jgi:peptide-methionine (R)-S-oxide reductase
MDRRQILQLGLGFVGTAWIFRTLFKQSQFAAAMTEETAMKPTEETFAVAKTEEEWRAELTPEAYQVLRKHGTERPRSSSLDKEYGPGRYDCAGCGQQLFAADTKFDSGTGWPSFWQPLEGAIATTTDKTLFMTRVEVHCSRCGGHLGHVFNDGPAPTGLRYCMNGVSLKYEQT